MILKNIYIRITYKVYNKRIKNDFGQEDQKEKDFDRKNYNGKSVYLIYMFKIIYHARKPRYVMK